MSAINTATETVDTGAKKVRNVTVIIAMIYIVFGLLLIVFPDQMKALVCIILGVISLVFGIVKLIMYFTKDRLQAALAYDLVVGILFAALGVIILIFQSKVMDILPVLFGIFLLISSLMKVQNAVDIKRLGGQKWWIVMIFAAVSVVLAILLILKPDFVLSMTFVVIGIFLVVDGVEGIASIIMYTKNYRKFKRAVKDAVNSVTADPQVTADTPAGEPTASGAAADAAQAAADAASEEEDPETAAASMTQTAGHLNFDPNTGKPLH